MTGSVILFTIRKCFRYNIAQGVMLIMSLVDKFEYD